MVHSVKGADKQIRQRVSPTHVVLWAVCHNITKHLITTSSLLSWLRQPEPTESFLHEKSPWTITLALLHTKELGRDEVQSVSNHLAEVFPAGVNITRHPDTVEFDGMPYRHGTEHYSRAYVVSDQTFGVFWEWCPQARTTRGCIWYSDKEANEQMQDFIREISASDVRNAHPLFLGLLALRNLVLTTHKYLFHQSEELVQAQYETGYHRYANERIAPNDHLNLERLAKHTSGLAVNLTTCSLCSNQALRFAQFLVDQNMSMITSLDSSMDNTLSNRRHDVEAYLNSWLRKAQALSDSAEAWRHKATIVVQTVFTLTTQRDQSLSIEISKDSRTLAEKATRDSSSMNAIAAVTMCFLPGTFVASLFATPLFDWDNSLRETVKPHFWVYWAVTIPLTIVVILVWLVRSHYNHIRVFLRSILWKKGSVSSGTAFKAD